MIQINSDTHRQPSITRFALGQTYVTPGAEEALLIAGQTGIEFLRRHMSQDWGELSDEDVRENELSLKEGFRLLSADRSADDPFTERILTRQKRERRECR